MKKVVCLIFCALGILFMAFWTFMYIFSCGKTSIPTPYHIVMIINIAIIGLSIVIGCTVIKVSIDQWFASNKDDVLSVKDRIIFRIVLYISIICMAIFISTIVTNNLNSVKVTEADNFGLQSLMLIMANSYMSYAYYQHLQVV